MKKLLILGVSIETKYVLDYAKSIGVYTIITDYLPAEKQPLKLEADEYWMIDVKDLDALEAQSRKTGIDGVFGGNHELCVEQSLKLARKLGLPAYASEEGWHANRDKSFFKDMIFSAGLNVPQNYSENTPIEDMKLPIIVKPVDSCASQGITVCHKPEEVKAAYEYAKSFSESKKIIVEEYVTGTETLAFIWAENGEYYLRALQSFKLTRSVPGMTMGTGYAMYDTERASKFLASEFDGVKRFLRKINWQNGPLFIQGIERDGKYYWFEMGARIDGMGFFKTEIQSGAKPMINRFVNFCLGLPMIDEPSACVNLSGKCVLIYNVICKSGTVTKTTGIEELKMLPGVFINLLRYKEGDFIPCVGNLRQVNLVAFIICDSWDEVSNRLKWIEENVHYYDEAGEDLMVY